MDSSKFDAGCSSLCLAFFILPSSRGEGYIVKYPPVQISQSKSQDLVVVIKIKF